MILQVHWMRMLDNKLVSRRDCEPGVSLGGVRCLSGGGRSNNGTHRPLLTTHILRAFQQVGMDVGDSGVNVRSLILDVGSDGMGVHDIGVSGGDGYVRVCCKFPL